MKKSENAPKIRVNAREHAIALVRSNGANRAPNIAKGCLEALNSPSQMLTAQEVESLRHFWTNVLGVLNKGV